MPAMSPEDIIWTVEQHAREDRTAYAQHLAALARFLAALFRERDLAGCTYFMSHMATCIVRYPTYEEWCDTPMLWIAAGVTGDLNLGLLTERVIGPVHRTMEERSSCPLHFGLQEFDRLYANFLAAHVDGDGTASRTIPFP